ncbi:MAG: polyprenyl synthetase family protein [Bacteroidales bacterium]|nr:polyprenyl synthetase family protein [Bacteroidales bacterium]
MKNDISKFNICLNKEIIKLIDNNQSFKLLLEDALMSGTRIRPLLCYLGYNIANKELKHCHNLISICVSVELLHKASIVLDDYLDKDLKRRNKDTFFKKHGSELSTIFPYFLLSKSFEIALDVTSIFGQKIRNKLLLLYKQTVANMAAGSVLEMIIEYNSYKKEDAININKLQSTTILRNSLLMGYLLKNSDEEKTYKVLSKIGDNIGFIFQTINDINSFHDDQVSITGRQYTDLIMNRNNIVIATALSTLSGQKKNHLMKLCANISTDIDMLPDILTILKNSKAILIVTSMIEQKVQNTIELVSDLPICPATIFLNKYIKKYKSSQYWTSSSLGDLLQI